MNILILQSDAVGDTVISTVVIDPLRKKYPDAKITYFTQERYIEWISKIDGVDACLVDTVKDKKGMAKLSAIWNCAKQLRKQRFDLSISIFRRSEYAWLTWLAGISTRVGHAFSLENRLLYTHHSDVDEGDMFRHMADWNLALVRALGISTELSKYRLPTYDVVPEKRAYCVLQYGAGHPGKLLPESKYRLMIDMILEQSDLDVVVHGSPFEAQQVASLCSAWPDSSRVSAQTTLPIDGLISLIQHAQCLISPDSGPLHIASATQTPCLAYFIRYNQNPFCWGPWQSPHLLLSSWSDENPEETVSDQRLKEGIQQLLTGPLDQTLDRKPLTRVAVSESIHKPEGYRCFSFLSSGSIKDIKDYFVKHKVHIVLTHTKRSYWKLKLVLVLMSNIIWLGKVFIVKPGESSERYL